MGKIWGLRTPGLNTEPPLPTSNLWIGHWMVASFYKHQSSSGCTGQAINSTVGSRAFPVADPKTWNALPEDVTSSQSEYTFHRQLKTWLFKKSFPDIII